jgi:hypothetical protein
MEAVAETGEKTLVSDYPGMHTFTMGQHKLSTRGIFRNITGYKIESNLSQSAFHQSRNMEIRKTCSHQTSVSGYAYLHVVEAKTTKVL